VIYLGTGLFMWVVRAFVPAMIVLIVGTTLAWIAHRVWRVPVRTLGLMVALTSAATLAWQTRGVVREFTHPQHTMFREAIAARIPAGVRDLEPGAPGPLVFHAGAVVAFTAPDAVLRALLDHSLDQSTALAFLADIKSRNGRDTATVSRVGADGSSAYVRVDSVTFPEPMRDVFRGAYQRVREADVRGLEAYVLAETGDWGRFESVVTYERATERVHVRQLVMRAPVPNGRAAPGRAPDGSDRP
jgi:hypothetical protein